MNIRTSVMNVQSIAMHSAIERAGSKEPTYAPTHFTSPLPSGGHPGTRTPTVEPPHCSIVEAEGVGYAHHFQFAVLEIAATHASDEEVLQRESHWKRVLGSREHGYNLN